MKKNYFSKTGLLVAASLGVCLGTAKAQTVQTFSYTGAVQTFTVPSCVNTITMEAQGAEGQTSTINNSAGGRGGKVVAEFTVSAGQVLYIYVGGSSTGYNGGGNAGGSYSGGGGGASDIRLNGTGLNNRILIAAGGGGGGYNCGSTSEQGGDGGGVNGGAGYQCGSQTSYQGTGGTQTGGGVSNGGSGQPGAFGAGGNGYNPYGGGGGGGYYGGGGGSYGGGGGGSSFAGTGTLSVVHTAGVRYGNGIVTFSYITQGSSVSGSAVSPEICEGGSTVLNASGVNSYTWSNNTNGTSISVSPLVTTSYTVEGTNSIGCVSKKIITVTVNPLPTITTAFSPSVLCVGSTGTLSASGASSYTWSTNQMGSNITVSPVVTTSYGIVGTSAKGCVNAGAATFFPVNTNSLTVTSNTAICAGQEVLLTVSGAGNYMWSTNSPFNQTPVSPQATTTYTVGGTDIHNCFLNASVTVSVNPKPNVQATTATTVVCKGDAVILTGTGANSYQWSSGSTAATETVMPILDVPTSYTLTGTSAEGCTNQYIITLRVKACTGINENNSLISSVYPNPSAHIFNVQIEQVMPGMSIEVYDSQGALVSSMPVTSSVTELDLQHLAEGIYMIGLNQDKAVLSRTTIIKK